MFAIISFIVLNLAIAGLTWWRSRRISSEYFLGKRKLTGPLVALSVLMTNFSTEQLVGLNGDAFRNGATAIAWEAFGAIGLVIFVSIFLPRYYAAGVTTIPQYVEQRCGRPVRRFISLLMVISTVAVGLPFVLYSGTLAMVGMFNLPAHLGLSVPVALFLTALALGAVGLIYALPGGMRGVAVSDLYYAVIFFVAATLIPILGLCALGDGNPLHGITRLISVRPAAFNPFGSVGQSLPVSALLTGMIVINLSAWCANQSAAQKAFAASSLVEGQKGMLMAAAVKLLAPFFFVLPGMIAWVLFNGQLDHADMSYASLVHRLLPGWLIGFFAVAVAGATITAVSGLVHSATTLFEVDLRRSQGGLTAGKLSSAGLLFGLATVVIAVVAVPAIAQQQTGFFVLMKRLNATLTIPVVSVVVPVVLTQLTWRPWLVKAAMLAASGTYLFFDLVVRGVFVNSSRLHWLHSVAVAFSVSLALLMVFGRRSASPREHILPAVGWKYAPVACWAILAGVVALYAGLWLLARG
ncbi:MAG TPA: solute:sodium symporter family transporter [Lacunisphaera sp.]